MFEIYRLVILKLQDIGLYLNFGKYENQRAGLPFNIPFKKGYAQNIKMLSRIYNGDYTKGSIFVEFVEFKLAGGNATCNAFISFCIDEEIQDDASLKCSVPFSLKDIKIAELNNLINEVKRKYHSDDTVESQISFFEYLKYTDITINGVDYVVNSDDELLAKLKVLIKYDLVNQALFKSYDALLKL